MSTSATDIQQSLHADFLNDLKEIVLEGKLREKELDDALLMVEEAQKKEEFIMNISYEMRTPLNMIMGFTQVLSEMGDTLTAEEKAEMGEHIRKGTETLTELLTEVLQFTRLESGRVLAASEEVDVSQLVHDAVAQHAGCTAEGVQLVATEGHPNVFITADKMRMQEILHQYISNAARYTQEGFIRVGWDYRPETNEVLIHVEDTGCGIAEEKQPEVFSLFWKEDDFTSGIGIGLTLVKRYTELMGGKLHFHSRYGKGCDFGVIFPAHLAHK